MSFFPDWKISSSLQKIIDLVSVMGNNMTPSAIVMEKKTPIFLSDHSIIKENGIFEEVTFLNSTNDSVDPYDYHVLKCGEGVLKTMERDQIHTFYPDEEAEAEGRYVRRSERIR